MTDNQQAIVRRIVRVAQIIEQDSRQKDNQIRASEIISLASMLTKNDTQ